MFAGSKILLTDRDRMFKDEIFFSIVASCSEVGENSMLTFAQVWPYARATMR